MYDDDAIALEYDGADVLQARYSHGESWTNRSALGVPRGATGAGSQIRCRAPGATPALGERDMDSPFRRDPAAHRRRLRWRVRSRRPSLATWN